MDVPSIVSLRHINGFSEVVTTVGSRVLWLRQRNSSVGIVRTSLKLLGATNARVGELIRGII